MVSEFKNPDIGARFITASQFPDLRDDGNRYFMFLWNDGNGDAKLRIDGRGITLKPDSITSTTYLHKVHIDKSVGGLKTLLFNREFYCVHTYDSEVSCNGLLFFGSHTSPVLKLDSDEKNRLLALFHVLTEEFSVRDANQEEMLRILLKRFIIRCTRLARQQILKRQDKQSDIDLVRQFNILVEEHFRTKKTVLEYADLLFKSPKTIANVFHKYSDETPLQIIHNRVIMEAKRMLYFTDKTAKEIGYELGYSDPAQFSKLFKKVTGTTVTGFKNSSNKIP